MCYLIPSPLVFLVWSLATPGAMGGLIFQGIPQRSLGGYETHRVSPRIPH